MIPAGCTHLLQPLDTHINKTIKASFRNLYTEWINDHGVGTLRKAGNIRLPSQELLVKWVLKSVQTVKATTIVQSFEHCGTFHLDLSN